MEVEVSIFTMLASTGVGNMIIMEVAIEKDGMIVGEPTIHENERGIMIDMVTSKHPKSNINNNSGRGSGRVMLVNDPALHQIPTTTTHNNSNVIATTPKSFIPPSHITMTIVIILCPTEKEKVALLDAHQIMHHSRFYYHRHHLPNNHNLHQLLLLLLMLH
jgi:hypothetical protein